MGFEDASTDSLMAIRDNLHKGLGVVASHLENGTFSTSEKEGAAPPSQSGWLTLALLLGVEDELECRVRGFERVLDPRLFSSAV